MGSAHSARFEPEVTASRMSTEIRITELALESGARFGTSGVRGRVEALTDRVCYAYVVAFLQHLQHTGQLPTGGRVAVAGDLRPSTDRIVHATLRAVVDHGYHPVDCGKIPSPALALYSPHAAELREPIYPWVKHRMKPWQAWINAVYPF